MKQCVLSKTTSFHAFQNKKKSKTVSFWATLFLFLLPLDVQQGKNENFCFFLFNSSCLSLLACFCLKPKAPRTPPHDEKSARTCSANPRPLAPWQGRLASLPTHSDRAAVGTPPAPLCPINTALNANRDRSNRRKNAEKKRKYRRRRGTNREDEPKKKVTKKRGTK